MVKELLREEEPMDKLCCCFCLKWKKLVSVGEFQKESNMCLNCYEKYIEGKL